MARLGCSIQDLGFERREGGAGTDGDFGGAGASEGESGGAA